MAFIPKDVQAAIAAAKGSLYGIPGTTKGFETACNVIRNWAQDNLEDDPVYDMHGEIVEYDFDMPHRTAEQKLRDMVGTDLYPHVK